MGLNPDDEDQGDEETSPLVKSSRPKSWQSEPNLFPKFDSPNYGTNTADDSNVENFGGKSNVKKPATIRTCKRFLGLFLGIIASTFLSLTTLFAKLLVDYHAFSKSLFRFIGILLPSIPILLYMKYVQKINVFDSVWPLTERTKRITFGVLFIRAFFGCTAVILQFYALDYIAIGDVSVVSFTTPVFVTILAYFVLKEKCGKSSIFAAVLSVVGIGIISRPPILSGQETFNVDTTIGVSLAFGCMAFATVTYVALRWLRPVDYAVVTFFYGLFSVAECLICSALTNSFQIPQTSTDWLFASAMALLAFFGQACFTMALKFEDAGPISLIRTLEVPLTFLWQIVFLAELPDLWSVLGGALILTSVVVAGLRKWILELPEDDSMRRRFKLFL